MAPAKIVALIFSFYVVSAVSAARSITGSESQSEAVRANYFKSMFGNRPTYLPSRKPPLNKPATGNMNGTAPLIEAAVGNPSGNTGMYSLSRKPGSNDATATATKIGEITSNNTATDQTGNCDDEPCQFLRAHNQVRASLGEQPLTWDVELEKRTRWWVGERKGDCALEHSFPQGEFQLGENIFWGGGSGWKPQDAVDLWADERKYYRYETNSCQDGQQCLHYTQIVWKKTTSVGCVRGICDSGDVFISCNYSPPGNYQGELPY